MKKSHSIDLELMCLEDFYEFSAITLHDEMLGRFLTYYSARTDDELFEILRDILDYPEAHYLYKLVNNHNQMVGWIQADILPQGELSLNYFIGHDFRKNGYLTCALEKLKPIAKSNGFFAIQAMIEPENQSSLQVVRNLGWTERSLDTFNLKSKFFRCVL